MTVTIGSKWINKISPKISATVVFTMEWKKTKHVVYALKVGKAKEFLEIYTLQEFLEHYRHPDTSEMDDDTPALT